MGLVNAETVRASYELGISHENFGGPLPDGNPHPEHATDATRQTEEVEAGMLRDQLKIEPEIIEAARRVEARYHAEQQQLALIDPNAAAEFFRAIAPSRQRLKADVDEPRVMKYIRYVEAHVRKWRLYTPYMSNLRKAFEIGVGPGYLFRIMIDLYGTDMRGCDLAPAKNRVFRDLREELGLSDRVMTHKVVAGQDIPIPEGSEAVLAFWTVFTETFSLDDHKWFVAQCREKLVGPKKLVFLFNGRGYDECPEVFEWYRTFGEFPHLSEGADAGVPPGIKLNPRDRAAFCVAEL